MRNNVIYDEIRYARSASSALSAPFLPHDMRKIGLDEWKLEGKDDRRNAVVALNI